MKKLLAASCEIGTQKKSRKGRLKSKPALFITLCAETPNRRLAINRLVVPV